MLPQKLALQRGSEREIQRRVETTHAEHEAGGDAGD